MCVPYMDNCTNENGLTLNKNVAGLAEGDFILQMGGGFQSKPLITPGILGTLDYSSNFKN